MQMYIELATQTPSQTPQLSLSLSFYGILHNFPPSPKRSLSLNMEHSPMAYNSMAKSIKL